MTTIIHKYDFSHVANVLLPESFDDYLHNMKNLLLLHGATGDEKQLIPLKEKLDDHYKVYTLNFSGHGGKPFPPGDFSIPLFAEEVKTFLKSNNFNEINIFGYSMGGYVAMYLASQDHPGIQKNCYFSHEVFLG